MSESTLVPREEMNDLDWLARNVHVWPAGDHQPWCYVYMAHGGVMKAAGNFLDAVAKPTMITIDQWLDRRAELQNKPSFSDHPDAKCFAQTVDGFWVCGFNAEKLTPSYGLWEVNSFTGIEGVKLVMDGSLPRKGEVLGDWRDTLEKRPEQTIADICREVTGENRHEEIFEPFVSVDDSLEKEMKRDDKWFERGELPPVGTECEIDLGAKWRKAFVVGRNYTGRIVVEIDTCDFIVADGCTFRPLRTERDELADLIESHGQMSALIVADAIIAAGFKLEVK